MKRIILVFSPILLSLIFFTGSFSQSHQGYYMHLDYLKIDHDEISSFEQTVVSSILPVQKARIEAGMLQDWYLYKVLYAATHNSPYNYVAVSISESIDSFEDIEIQFGENLTDEEIQEHLSALNEILIPVHSELWRINNSILQHEDAKPSRYFGMDYMRVRSGMEYAYQMMEDEMARPLHESRMELDRMNGWELFGLISPGGTEYGYNFATGNYYKQLKNIEFGFTEELIRQNHPDTNVNDFFENIDQTRDLVRSEIWELVDFVK